jgi:hypothetical protein
VRARLSRPTAGWLRQIQRGDPGVPRPAQRVRHADTGRGAHAASAVAPLGSQLHWSVQRANVRRIAPRQMMQIRNVQLHDGYLSPVNWQVRDAVSPLWLAWDWRPRWWALLFCDQGVAAFQWPTAKLMRVQLVRWPSRWPTVSGDSWPLTERGAVSSPSALIFARDHLTRIDAIDSRFLWKKIRLYERNGHQATFVLANREQIVLCVRLLCRHFAHAADPEVDSRA